MGKMKELYGQEDTEMYMPFVTNVSMVDAKRGRFPSWCNSNTVLIQIQDLHCSPFHDKEGFVNVKNRSRFLKYYQFKFDDVDDPNHINQITKDQAKQIAEIIKDCYENKYNLVSHCHAGLCRSGAVTEAALMYGFADVDKNKRIPNTIVKNMIRKELGIKFSFEEEE